MTVQSFGTGRVAVDLAGDLAAALFLAQLHEDGDRRHAVLEFRRQLGAVEAALEFLGDEVRRELAGAKARVRHHRLEERHVVLDAVDVEMVERVGHEVDRRPRASAAWVQSLAIIGS